MQPCTMYTASLRSRAEIRGWRRLSAHRSGIEQLKMWACVRACVRAGSATQSSRVRSCVATTMSWLAIMSHKSSKSKPGPWQPWHARGAINAGATSTLPWPLQALQRLQAPCVTEIFLAGVTSKEQSGFHHELVVSPLKFDTTFLKNTTSLPNRTFYLLRGNAFGIPFSEGQKHNCSQHAQKTTEQQTHQVK